MTKHAPREVHYTIEFREVAPNGYFKKHDPNLKVLLEAKSRDQWSQGSVDLDVWANAKYPSKYDNSKRAAIYEQPIKREKNQQLEELFKKIDDNFADLKLELSLSYSIYPREKGSVSRQKAKLPIPTGQYKTYFGVNKKGVFQYTEETLEAPMQTPYINGVKKRLGPEAPIHTEYDTVIPHPEALTWSQFADQANTKDSPTEWEIFPKAPNNDKHHPDDVELWEHIEPPAKAKQYHSIEDEPDQEDTSIQEIKHLKTGSKESKKEIGIMQRSKKYAKPKPRKVPDRADVKNKKHLIKIIYLAIDYARDHDLIQGSAHYPANKNILRELINTKDHHSITVDAFDNYMKEILEDKPIYDLENSLVADQVMRLYFTTKRLIGFGRFRHYRIWIEYGIAAMEVSREEAHKMLNEAFAAETNAMNV